MAICLKILLMMQMPLKRSAIMVAQAERYSLRRMRSDTIYGGNNNDCILVKKETFFMRWYWIGHIFF